MKIRAHQLGQLFTEPNSKVAKDAGNISETAKTLIDSIWLKEKYGYDEPVVTDEMLKGLMCEQDSINLVQSVLGGKFRIKNHIQFENEFLKGTPDIILDDVVEDIKTSWSLKTFFQADLKKSYYWQGQAYMMLTGVRKYRLIYCLIPTPEETITELKKRIWFKYGCDETNADYVYASTQIDFNNKVIMKIPDKKRVKVFEFYYEKEFEANLKNKYTKSLEYYNTLSL